MLYTCSNCTSLQTLFNRCMAINCSVLFTLYIDSLCCCLIWKLQSLHRLNQSSDKFQVDEFYCLTDILARRIAAIHPVTTVCKIYRMNYEPRKMQHH